MVGRKVWTRKSSNQEPEIIRKLRQNLLVHYGDILHVKGRSVFFLWHRYYSIHKGNVERRNIAPKWGPPKVSRG